MLPVVARAHAVASAFDDDARIADHRQGQLSHEALGKRSWALGIPFENTRKLGHHQW